MLSTNLELTENLHSEVESISNTLLERTLSNKNLIKVFSEISDIEQIKVRVDDVINKIAINKDNEDLVLELIEQLFLLHIAIKNDNTGIKKLKRDVLVDKARLMDSIIDAIDASDTLDILNDTDLTSISIGGFNFDSVNKLALENNISISEAYRTLLNEIKHRKVG